MKQQFTVPFEVAPEQPPELAAYLVDREGQVIASSPIREGRFEFDILEARGHELRVSIAPIRPDLGERLPTQDQLARLRAYEPVFSFDPKAKTYELKAIPGEISKWWLLCSCRVRGRVVKPVTSGGVTVDMPVCGARVHICEMDPIWIFLARLPDREIFRLRDEILAIIRRPPPPPPPGPDPGPIGPIGPLEPRRFRQVAEAGAPLPQMSGPPMRRAETAPAVFGEAFVEAAAPSGMAQLPLEAHLALNSPSATIVRAALRESPFLIYPYICWWPWIWPWFWRCDEVAVIESDDNGRFDVTISHSCSDQPDLYFWVEYFIDGTWTTVYDPWRPCGTYWDFDCASEVTIRVTDPRVPYCGGHDSPEGNVVVVKTIGNDISISEILGSAAGTREGLTVWPDGGLAGQDSPFAGTLELRADFGDALFASGVTKYRWSYRQLEDATGAAVADSTHVMTRQVVRHYRTMVAGNPIDLIHTVGPQAGNYFEVWNPVATATPVGDHNWQVDDAHEDIVSGFFETAALDPTLTRDQNIVGNHLDDAKAGLYELTLELFHANDSLVDWTAEGIGLFEANVAAPFGVNPMTTQSSPDEHRILSGALHTMGFRLHVFVDNSFCQAAIFDVTSSGNAAGPCGFIEYTPGATANVSFQARQAHDFAAFWFEVDKGSSGTVAPASVPAWAPVGVSPADGFVRGAGSVWAKDIPVTGFGSLVDSPAPCPDGRAAFAETIWVAASGTDGWYRAYWLDASATPKAFALTLPP